MAVADTTQVLAPVESELFEASPWAAGSIDVVAGRLYIICLGHIEGTVSAVSVGGNAATLIEEETSSSNSRGSVWGYVAAGTASAQSVSVTHADDYYLYATVRETSGQHATYLVSGSNQDDNSTSSPLTLAMPDMADTTNNLRFVFAHYGIFGGTPPGSASVGGSYTDKVNASFETSFIRGMFCAEGRTNTDPTVTIDEGPNLGLIVIGFEIAAAAGGGGDEDEALTGAAASIGTAAGTLGSMTTLGLAGAAAAIVAAIGSLGVGDTVTLTGAEAAIATAIGSVGLQELVAGSNAGITTAAGTLGVTDTVALTGSNAGIATAAGTIGAAVAANPQLVIGDPTSFVGYSMVGPSSGEIFATGAGAGIGTAVGAFGVEDTLPLTGSGASIATAIGALGPGITVALAGAAAGVLGETGTLAGLGGLSGAAAGIATAAGSFYLEQLTGQTAGIVTATGSFPGFPVGMSGSDAAIVTAAGTLGAGFAVALTGSGAGLLAEVGAFGVDHGITLAGLGAGIATAAGTLVASTVVLIRIGSVSTRSALSLGSVSARIPGSIAIGKVETD